MIKEITDPRLRCGAGACPGVYKTDQGKLIIVGSKPSAYVLNELRGRFSDEEQVIEIDLALIQNFDDSSLLKSD